MQTFISKGATVKEAIQLGLEMLNIDMEQVHIEIIQTEKKGLLGMGSKDAIVKLSRQQVVKPTMPNPTVSAVNLETEETLEKLSLDDFLEQFESIETKDDLQSTHETHRLDEGEEETEYSKASLAGKAWVKNGRLSVKEGINDSPSINVGEGIKVRKNGKIVTDDSIIFLSEQDQVDIELLTVTEKTDWQIRLDKDNLAARLEIKPGYIIKRKLADTAPGYQIKLDAVEEKEPNQTVTHQMVMEELNKLSISFGVDEDAINLALESVERDSFIIAKGKKSTDGENGWVEQKVETSVKDNLKERQEQNAIDFREQKTIPTVEKGQIIGVVHPSKPGQSGQTVTGQVLEAAPVHEVKVTTQKGTILLEDKIIANANGRPYLETRKQFVKTKVLPQMVHDGNVDMSSGNIHFQGDIEITGQVEESMTIESGGSITVHRTVNGANLHALKSIEIRGSVNASDLSAGAEINIEIQSLLNVIHQQTEKMYVMIKQITQSKVFKVSVHRDTGIGALIILLKEKHFTTLTADVRQFIDLVHQEKKYLIDEEWQELSDELKDVFLTLSKHQMSLVSFQQLLDKVIALKELSEMQNNDDAGISVTNSLNSKLTCSGDIVITGRSCINTEMRAEGFIKVAGVVRGGHIYAGHGVDLNEVGAKMGTKTFISVPYDQKIRIGKVMEGTVLKIGVHQYIFEDNSLGVYARLNQNEELLLH